MRRICATPHHWLAYSFMFFPGVIANFANVKVGVSRDVTAGTAHIVSLARFSFSRVKMCHGGSIVLDQRLFRSLGIAQALNRSPETFATRLRHKEGQNIVAIDSVRAELQP